MAQQNKPKMLRLQMVEFIKTCDNRFSEHLVLEKMGNFVLPGVVMIKIWGESFACRHE